MHLLENTKPIDMGRPGVLEPGRWLCHDQNAFELAMLADKGSARLKDHWKFIKAHIDQGDIIFRSGALGDLLFLGPALKAFKDATGFDVRLSCFPSHQPLFQGSGIVDEFLPYPLPKEALGADEIIDLAGAELSTTEHMTDTFANALGVSVTDYKPIYVVREDEKAAATTHFSGKRPLLGIQMRSSTENRNYPPNQWLEVILKLEQRGWEIVLLGSKGQIAPMPVQFRTPFIHNLSEKDLSFRESAAVLSHCDAFVGVDSVWLHMCHALDIRAVGLYGPFDWKLRTSKAPLTEAISGIGECAPCFWHAHAGRHFPKNQPCSTTGRCIVLAGIHVDRIVRKVDALKP